MVGCVWARTPTASQALCATASAMSRPHALEVAGKRVMKRVPRGGGCLRSPGPRQQHRWCVPGATPCCPRNVAMVDKRVLLMVFSEALPSSGLPQRGTARSTHSREDELLEIRPLVFAIAMGNRKGDRLRLLVCLPLWRQIIPIDADGRGIGNTVYPTHA